MIAIIVFLYSLGVFIGYLFSIDLSNGWSGTLAGKEGKLRIYLTREDRALQRRLTLMVLSVVCLGLATYLTIDESGKTAAEPISFKNVLGGNVTMYGDVDWGHQKPKVSTYMDVNKITDIKLMADTLIISGK